MTGDSIQAFVERWSPSGGAISSSNLQRTWELDQLGNWSKLRNGLKLTSTVLEDRAHNGANELTGYTTPSGNVDPVHDLAGNMTTIPRPASPSKGYTLKYDPWNRLVEVKAGASLVQTNEYDGLGRRIRKDSPDQTADIDFYYNEEWQVLEERKIGDVDPLAQYVWHPYYIDALAVRYYDADIDNNLAENNDGTHYYCQDANFNVTAIVNASGTVLERYGYLPYGKATVLDANFALDANNFSDIGNNCLFTGREHDSVTGLQLNRNRFYACHLGRWINRDPIEYVGGLNLYEYVEGMPTYFVDPSGLSGFNPPPSFDPRDPADWPPGKGEHCAALLRRINNVRNRIKKRFEKIKEDPLELPSTHPDDKRHPSKSVRGHWDLIAQDKALLDSLTAMYEAQCRPKPKPQPQPELCPKGPIIIPIIGVPEPPPAPKPGYIFPGFWLWLYPPETTLPDGRPIA